MLESTFFVSCSSFFQLNVSDVGQRCFGVGARHPLRRLRRRQRRKLRRHLQPDDVTSFEAFPEPRLHGLVHFRRLTLLGNIDVQHFDILMSSNT